LQILIGRLCYASVVCGARWLCLVVGLVFACSSGRPPHSSSASVASQPSSPGDAITSPKPMIPSPSPSDRGPCRDAHDCELRDYCGCSCPGVLHSAPPPDCTRGEGGLRPEKTSCAYADICEGYVAVCDLATHTCDAHDQRSR
jgi:hypothetical protein